MRSGRRANLSATFRHCSCCYFANASTVKLFQERGETLRAGLVGDILTLRLAQFSAAMAFGQDVATVGRTQKVPTLATTDECGSRDARTGTRRLSNDRCLCSTMTRSSFFMFDRESGRALTSLHDDQGTLGSPRRSHHSGSQAQSGRYQRRVRLRSVYRV
jgi:hypothetical protein